MSMPSRQRTSQSHGHRAAACSQIGPASIVTMRRKGWVPEAIQCQVDEELRLLSWDQGCGIDLKIQVTPGTTTDEMLQRNMVVQMSPPKVFKGFQRAGQ